MKNERLNLDPIPSRLKHLIVDLFRLDIAEPDQIANDAPLIGGSLGLDSLDALELAMAVEEMFGLVIHSREESLHAFASIDSLTRFIHSRAPAGHPPSAQSATEEPAVPELTSPAVAVH